MATKYIDADQIRAEIERRRDFFYKRFLKKGIGCVEESRYDECVEILSFIDSLPDCKVCTKGNGRVKDEVFDALSEQPVDGLEEEVKRYYSNNFDYISSDQPTLSILTNIARHFYELGQQNRPKISDTSLEEEIAHYLREECSGDEEPSVSEIARHFAEWGRKQVLQEIYEGKVKPVDKITAAWLDDEQNT